MMTPPHDAPDIRQLVCLRCGYCWYPRRPQLPKVCPNLKCKSPYWHIPRSRPPRGSVPPIPPPAEA